MQKHGNKNLYNNKVSVAVVRNDSGKVLIVKRKQEIKDITGGKLSWTFPSCAVPEDSTLELIMALAEDRALKEAGYRVKALDKISERVYHSLGNHITYIHCAIIDSDVQEKEDENIEAYAWVHPHDLNKYFTSSLDIGVAKFLGL